MQQTRFWWWRGSYFRGSLCGSSRYPQVSQRVPMSPSIISERMPGKSGGDLNQSTFNFNLENILTGILSRLLWNSINIDVIEKTEEWFLPKYFILRYANIWPATFWTIWRLSKQKWWRNIDIFILANMKQSCIKNKHSYEADTLF